MSVWGTRWEADGNDHTDTCAVWTKADGGDAPKRNCTCDCPAPPYEYLGSHVLPRYTHPRRGSISLASIPSHITYDGRDDGPDDEWGLWPWLRLSVGEADAVLDEALVRGLRDALDGWLTEREGKT